MPNSSLSTVILAGGKGTRLWPVSRRMAPKQFMRFAGEHSMLKETVNRITPVCDNQNIWIVTSPELATGHGYDEIGAMNHLLEPEPRNTAPAVGVMAAYMADFADDPVILILPADHMISDIEAFHEAIESAQDAADEGALVTFGIHPDHPETGFGYIKVDGDVIHNKASDVAEFVEKPDLATAEAYLDSGQYLWNSGMFVFKASRMLSALKEHAPNIHDVIETMRRAWKNDQASWQSVVTEFFKDMPSISIDYAVMEKAENVKVVPCDIGWNDVGSWDAVYEITEKDAHGNAIDSPIDPIMIESKNSLISGRNRIISTIGIEDLCIVDTEDALLISKRGETQKVKDVVEQVEKLGGEAHVLHTTAHRPWGSYTVLEDREIEHYKLKRINVKPGGRLSLQSHKHRSEHWIVVAGVATVTCDENVFDLPAGESTFIPVGSKHRLENKGKQDLKIIEVQVGDYLGEDDIERYDDVYGRS